MRRGGSGRFSGTLTMSWYPMMRTYPGQCEFKRVKLTASRGTVTHTHRNIHLVLDGVESITSTVCSPVTAEPPLKECVLDRRLRQYSMDSFCKSEPLYRTELDRIATEPPIWQHPPRESVVI